MITARPAESTADRIGRTQIVDAADRPVVVVGVAVASAPTVSLMGAPEIVLTTVAKVSELHGLTVALAASTWRRSEVKRAVVGALMSLSSQTRRASGLPRPT